MGGAHGRTAARPHAGAQRLGPPARSFWGFEEARWVAWGVGAAAVAGALFYFRLRENLIRKGEWV